jgi:hypothetical protein
MYSQDVAPVAQLRAELETIPAVPIEQAAELLEVSVRTLYRWRGQFEHRRRRGHLYFTLRSIRQYIELEQYNPTPLFDVTLSDTFDSFDSGFEDTRIRRTGNGRSAMRRRAFQE